MAEKITVVPANEASEADLEAVFATPGDPRRCWCQWFKTDTNGWSRNSVAQRRALLLEQAAPGHPRAATTGLVAHVDGAPAGWVAVEPRTAYQRLLRSRTVWTGREEDRTDDGVAGSRRPRRRARPGPSCARTSTRRPDRRRERPLRTAGVSGGPQH